MEILSQIWSLLGILTILQNILPTQILSLFHSFCESLQDFFSPYVHFEIPEFNGYCGLAVNDLYRHVNLYINSVNPSSSCGRLSLSRSTSSKSIAFNIAPNHTVHDHFQGHRLSWTHHVETIQENRSFTLKLPKRHRMAILSCYLDHVTTRAAEFERASRERRLFINDEHGSYESGWSSVPFRHPSTFQTLALEPELKKQLVDDLKSFSEGKEFYKRIGHAWKRGYLLHGPPGSGKSSLIAAMANLLCYDVYDLELSKVRHNSELRALLIQTKNRSIIVIEDIDCSIDLTGDRQTKQTQEIFKPKNGRKDRNLNLNWNGDQNIVIGDSDGGESNVRVTLSGLLNFSDGLWSCCGEERIIVFTTNHKDSLDPALVRCGRMDVHVSLGACGMAAFKALVKNYLGLDSHVGFDAVESCIRSCGGLTPAQIAEILLRNRRDADAAVNAVVTAMQAKILDADDVARMTTELAVDREGSPEEYGGKKPKPKEGSNYSWERKVNLLVRLKSLTKSDSGRRGA